MNTGNMFAPGGGMMVPAMGSMTFRPQQQPQQQQGQPSVQPQVQPVLMPVMMMPNANLPGGYQAFMPAMPSVQQQVQPYVMSNPSPNYVTTATAVPVAGRGSASGDREKPLSESRRSAAAAATGDNEGGPSALAPAARADPATRYTGTVIEFDVVAGYGFVHCDALYHVYDHDVFIHKRQFTGLAVGDQIEFNVVHNQRGQPQVREPRFICRQPPKRRLKQRGHTTM
eukprot:TRINITY_DN2356_c0_g4_i2.p2 TRINITY_DN2356_c0_g4~~TRINITY_DN2356_c0_g4_i2.p2  ORF type:complete len:227 (+),score=40.46 TRINITY_DN2356_c0_g4_i2:135-815(+)